MRCYECGNRVTDGQEECPTCHAALWALGPAAADTPAPLTVAVQGDSSVATIHHGRQDIALPPSRGQMVLQQTGSVVSAVASAAQSALALVIPAQLSVQGRVIIADTPHQEDPDLDACRIITRILWILMLLPVVLLLAIPICLIFRRASPLNLFATLGIFKFMNPAGQSHAQVPVRYYRIREDSTDAEVMVRMKGHFTHGNLGQDDIVTLHGRSRGGTLYASHGYNHRTGSTIRVTRSYSWVGLVLTLLFILALVIEFHEPTARIARTAHALGGAQ